MQYVKTVQKRNLYVFNSLYIFKCYILFLDFSWSCAATVLDTLTLDLVTNAFNSFNVFQHLKWVYILK